MLWLVVLTTARCLREYMRCFVKVSALVLVTDGRLSDCLPIHIGSLMRLYYLPVCVERRSDNATVRLVLNVESIASILVVYDLFSLAERLD